MGKVDVESSTVLLRASNCVGEVKNAMQDNLGALLNAFENACKRWQDSNSQACDKALQEHCAVMRSALGQLESAENALNRLGQLASEYENID